MLYLFAIFSGLLADHFAPALKAVISGVFDGNRGTERGAEKSRRGRNVALGVLLAGLVVLFYVITIIKIGSH